jgi:hypothetical protein
MKNQSKLSNAEQRFGLNVEIVKDLDVSGILKYAGRFCRRIVIVILGALLCLAGFGKAETASIIYIWSGIGSGSLGSNSFMDAPFTITSTANISQITEAPLGVLLVANIAATISISGMGIATFTIPTDTVANRSNSLVGIGAPIQDDAILFVGNDAFATYDLGSPIGPIAGPPFRSIEAKFATTAGIFSLSAVSTATFQAVFEPSRPSVSIYTAVEVCWPTETNKTYQLQWAPSLGSVTWMSLGSPVPGTGTNICIFESTRGMAKRFYRLEVLP